MNPDPNSLIVGLCVACLGGLLGLSHRATWLRKQREFTGGPRELRHLQVRYRRRVQASGLIVFVGLMIPIADLPLVWRQGPMIATLLWGAIGCVCLWIVLLAIGDLASTTVYSKVELARLQAQHDDLIDELKRLRSRNGKPPTDDKPSDES